MELDNEAILSDRQSMAAVNTGTLSTNHIDLQSYNQIVGYGKGVANFTGDATAGNANPLQSNPLRQNVVTTGRYDITRLIGEKKLTFLGMINDALTVASGAVPDLAIDFIAANSIAASNTLPGVVSGAEQWNIVTTVTIPSAELKQGTQIPWPSMPRYLTRQLFVLRYRSVNSTAYTGGTVTMGFATGVPTRLY